MRKLLISVLLIELCIVQLCYSNDDDDELCSSEQWGVNIVIYNHNPQTDVKKYDFNDLKLNLKNIFHDKIFINSILTNSKNESFLSSLEKHQEHITGFYFERQIVTLFLDVEDFYKFDYSETLKRNYVYAGDGIEEVNKPVIANRCNITYYSYHDICSKWLSGTDGCINVKNTHKKKGYQDSHKDKHKTQNNCDVSVKQHHVKLISNNVLNFPTLYQFFKNYTGNYVNYTRICPSVKPLAIIVSHESLPRALQKKYSTSSVVDIKNLNINNCRNEITMTVKAKNPTAIAVLAPKPFSFNQIISVDTTTVFYDYTDPEKEDPNAHLFLNSITLMPMEKTMYALRKFMQMYKLHRVAVISDDLPSSKEYEQKLTALLEKDKVIYVSRSCDVSNCNFTEMISPLVATQAKIIIANVDDGSNLAQHVQQWKYLVWLFRSSSAAKAAAEKGAKKVFSITMKPNKNILETIIPHLETSETVKEYLEKVHNKPKDSESQKFNHSKFAEEIRNKLYNDTSIIAHVIRHADTTTKTIAVMTILPSNEVIAYKQHERQDDIHPELTGCTIKSKIYMKPCYDEEYMFFMLVLSVFSLMVVIIVYYFKSADLLKYSRMP